MTAEPAGHDKAAIAAARSLSSHQHNEASGNFSGGLVQANHIGLVAFSSTPQPIYHVPMQAPHPPSQLIHRTDELTALDILADKQTIRPMIAVLSGMSGVGKSAIASQWAVDNRGRFSDGQLYADLTSYRHRGVLDVSDILASFLRALGVRSHPTTLPDRIALFRTVTASGRVLVILDDVDQPEQVLPFLPGSPQSAVIVTSRSRLTGLAVDDAGMIEVRPLDLAHSVLLIDSMLPASHRGDLIEVRRLAELCGGLPIALRIIGALLSKRRHWPPSRLLRYLADERRRLSRISLPGSRQLDLLFTTASSHLTSTTRNLYQCIGLHPGMEFGRQVIEAVTGLTADDADDALDQLLEANLLQDVGHDRYRMHSLIKLHAQQTAERSTHADGTLQRIIEWYRLGAAAADLAVLGESRWRLAPISGVCPTLSFTAASGAAWFEAERANLLTAVRSAARKGWHRQVWQLCEALWASHHSRKHYADAIDAHELGVEAARQCGDQVVETRMLNQLARARIALEEYGQAAKDLTDAWIVASACADVRARAVVAESSGVLSRDLGQFEASAEHFRTSLALNDEAGDKRGSALQRYHLGDVLVRTGQASLAVPLLLEALEAFHSLRDELAVARTQIVLGAAYSLKDEDRAACTALLTAIRTMRRRKQYDKESLALEILIRVAHRIGDAALFSGSQDRFAELNGARPRQSRVGPDQAGVRDRHGSR